ncbi:MAG: RHS repeat-associated core domain-containing protein [Phycisphaeraceae bacterium]
MDDNGDATWELDRTRTHTPANEIDTISGTWLDPAHDASGNMVGMPKPLDPTQGYTAVYDAWNRLVELTDDNGSSSGGGQLVAEYEWDGIGRRIVATNYDDGLLEETRHFYYSQAHQILEERVDGTADSDMDLQYVWGAQYVDELICRDRPGDASSSSSSADAERIYVTYDPSYRITALVDGNKNVLERYRYSPYGERTVLNPDWTVHTDPINGSYNFRIGHQGLRHDETGLVYNRARMLHVGMGRFAQRDPMDHNSPSGGYHDGMSQYEYQGASPIQRLDPRGLDLGDTVDTLFELAAEVYEEYEDVAPRVRFVEDVVGVLRDPHDLVKQEALATKYLADLMKKALTTVAPKVAGRLLYGFDIGVSIGETFRKPLQSSLDQITDNKRCAQAAAKATHDNIPANQGYWSVKTTKTSAEMPAFSTNEGSGAGCARTYYIRKDQRSAIGGIFWGPDYTWKKCCCSNHVAQAEYTGSADASL